jgi:hypothetical protein
MTVEQDQGESMTEVLPVMTTTLRRPLAAVRLGAVAEVTIRRQVNVPLRFADGYATTALVTSFDGLADGKEHLALSLGDWQGALRRSASPRPCSRLRRGPSPEERPPRRPRSNDPTPARNGGFPC